MLLVIPYALSPAIMFDPELKWSSIKTAYFWIHYHQGLEDEAERLATLAEKIHYRLQNEIKWKPFLRTDVILVDNRDMANGFATPFPFNRIQIYITRPKLDSLLNHFNDWMELIFTHEYTHILNLDTINGIPSLSRYTLGRVCFPNAFLPIWLIEGNAVYHESIISNYGRNNSIYTDMVMRTEILYDNLKSITEASAFPREWPMGRVPYLYGGLFIEFLEKKYGRGSIADVFVENSYNIIPFYDNTFPYVIPFIDTNAENVLGESFVTLWDEWIEFINIKYKNQISIIREKGLTDYNLITESGYGTSLPRFSINGDALYFIRYTNYNKPALMKYSMEKRETKELCAVNYPNSIAISTDEGIYLSDAEYYRSFSIYNEAFKYKKGYKRLTSRLRGSYIDVSSLDSKVVCVLTEKDRYSLAISDIRFNEFKRIISNSDIQLGFTRFSPDGKKIIFSIKDRRGYTDLMLLNIENNEMFRLTDDMFNDITPSWHPDGRKILFSSDRSGVYNLYEINIQEGTITQLTNLLGGAFSPDISLDGNRIAFTSYNKNGFNIALMKYPNNEPLKEEIDIVNTPINFFERGRDIPQSDKRFHRNSYSLWNSIFPPFWIPIIASEEIYNDEYQWVLGFYTLGTDTLFQHSYTINCYAYTHENRVDINILYMLSRFYPNIIFEYENETLFYGDDEFPWKDKNPYAIKRTIEKSGIVKIFIPFKYYHTYHSFSFSYIYQKAYTDSYRIIGHDPMRWTNILARIRGVYYFRNTDMYSYSISQENGRALFLISDIYSKRIASDYSFYKVRGEYAEYLPGIARNNVLMLRIRGGASFNNPEGWEPYNLGRFEKGEKGSVSTDEDEFGLRGYSAGLVYGNRIATGTIEYRFPILQIDLGYATFPIMLRDFWLSPFFEYGNVWDKKTRIEEFKSSAGIELHTRITLGYYIDLTGYVGYCRGFNDYGEDQVYFAVGTLFEGAFKKNYEWLDYL
ncbi:MAG: BamA/TamA family outer membrane protein [Spirochaetota bacterium]|nr:BamA/TamA family outer membrane protein [Spirochaetota bacterium]